MVCEDLNPTHSTRRPLQINYSTNEASITKAKPELIQIDEGEIRSHLVKGHPNSGTKGTLISPQV